MQQNELERESLMTTQQVGTSQFQAFAVEDVKQEVTAACSSRGNDYDL